MRPLPGRPQGLGEQPVAGAVPQQGSPRHSGEAELKVPLRVLPDELYPVPGGQGRKGDILLVSVVEYKISIPIFPAMVREKTYVNITPRWGSYVTRFSFCPAPSKIVFQHIEVYLIFFK